MRYFLTITLLILAVGLSACSKQELYTAAMDFERSSAGLESHDVQVGDLSITYLSNKKSNDGKTLVMIHGFTGNKDNWVRMAKQLTDTYNVYAIDLPGHGDSTTRIDLDYRLEDQMGYVKQTLDALGLDEVHMMGNSMGGGITALYAANYPEQLKSAILFNPAGVLKYDSELVTMVKDEDVNPLLVSEPGDMKRMLNLALVKKPFIPWPITGVMEDMAIANKDVYEKIFLSIRDVGFDEAFRKTLEDTVPPVLIVWGKEDRILNYRNSEVFEQRIPNSSVTLLDDIGHVPMIEVPKRSAELVGQFVQ